MMLLLQEACEHVTGSNWENVVRRTRDLIRADWDRDVRVDTFMDQPFIIHLGDSSDDGSEEIISGSDNE